MQQEYKLGQLEALLFAAGEPLAVPQLAELLGLNKPQTWELLGLLQEEYSKASRGLELREVAEGWQLCTKACHHEAIYVQVQDTILFYLKHHILSEIDTVHVKCHRLQSLSG